MRPGQNRRVRGRTNRKGPNPLTRSYESNGPDVKIRGTAQHIAEKYTQLARDAQVAGDPVASENYLQHAEHYFRIIAAAQSQFQQAYGQGPRPYDDGEDGDFDDEFNDAPAAPRLAAAAQPDDAYPVGAPQPGQPAPAYRERQERFERPQRGERFDRQERGDRQDRGERAERQPRQERQPRGAAEGAEQPEGERAPRGRRERFRRDRDARSANRELDFSPAPAEGEGGLPAFLTTPLRPVAPAEAPAGQQPAPVEAAEPPASAAPETHADDAREAAGEEGGERLLGRARRRRGRTRAEGQADHDAEQSAAG